MATKVGILLMSEKAKHITTVNIKNFLRCAITTTYSEGNYCCCLRQKKDNYVIDFFQELITKIDNFRKVKFKDPINIDNNNNNNKKNNCNCDCNCCKDNNCDCNSNCNCECDCCNDDNCNCDCNEINKEISDLKEQIKFERDKYVRTIAEFENFRKRVKKEQIEFIEMAEIRLLNELLSVLKTFTTSASK